jgi:DNA modification methylase
MATLLLGDCLQHMASLAAKSIDCFICDLPYGITACEWDKRIDLAAFWTQVERLASSPAAPVIMFCNTKFGYELIASQPSWFRYDMVWDKGMGRGFLRSGKRPLCSHEMIYVFSKKAGFYRNVKVAGEPYRGIVHAATSEVYKLPAEREAGTMMRTDRCVKSIVSVHTAPKRGGGLHPTEKPEELYRWLLERYCPEGGCMLDPTAGSFNSVACAQAMGLKGIGIEADRAYFYKAVGRFSKGIPLAVREGNTIEDGAE